MPNPPDQHFPGPWMEPLVFGVRREFRWDAVFLRRMRLHFWLAYWNPSRGAALLIDGATVALEPGVVVLVPAGTWLQRKAERPFDHWWCHLRVAAEPATAGPIILPAKGELGRLFARSWDAAWRAAPQAMASTAHVHAAVAEALARVPWRESGVADARIAQLLAELERQGLPRLGNRAMAERLGLHPTAFCRRFALVVGVPPQDWLRKRRLDVAAERLVRGVPVAEVAELGGFTDRFHLSRQFRQYHGMPPGEYQRLAARIDGVQPT